MINKRSAAVRRAILLGLLALATIGIVARAVYLQVFYKDFLIGQADMRHVRTVEVPAHRGMIVDRNGEPLAASSPVDSIWADPRDLAQARERLPALAKALGTDTNKLTLKLDQSVREGRKFLYLKRHLDPSEAHQVMALDMPGVFARREYRRFYPDAEVLAGLLGFTNIDDAGQEGLELTYDARLRGVAGVKRVVQDGLHRVVEDLDYVQVPQPGQTVTLSIDRRIQYLAYRALKAALIEHHASAASAIVVDVDSGEILALVNQPSVNPNDHEQRRAELLRNHAVADVYEPGSTLKPFTVALALEYKRFTPASLIDTRPGFLHIGRYLVKDIHNYGLIDVARVLSKSSNVGVSKIALSMPPERLWKLYADIGFGASTGLDLVGENAGSLSHYAGWNSFEYATHAFGYGLSVNLLQLAQAYAVLAADGVKRPLSMLRREPSAGEGKRLLAVDTTRKVRAMLEAAVSAQGTGFRATVNGYRVAGKTGTVHKVFNGRYAEDRYYSLFAGMAPASRPRLVMVVMIDDPKGAYYGGEVAAPVFSRLMEGALRLLNIPPDGEAAETMVVDAGRKPE